MAPSWLSYFQVASNPKTPARSVMPKRMAAIPTNFLLREVASLDDSVLPFAEMDSVLSANSRRWLLAIRLKALRVISRLGQSWPTYVAEQLLGIRVTTARADAPP
jgi:hypothetical protein